MSIDVTGDLSPRVASEIRVAMARRGVTGAKLAQELGVSQAWVSYRLTGQQEIGINDLQRIATVLNVKVADLVGHAERGDGTYVIDESSLRKRRSPSMIVTPRSPVSGFPGTGRPAGRTDISRPPGIERRTAPTGR